ncbi:MAG: hypothetical protein SH856_11525 [Flavobacteriales bacterium]|nr:hypothetical protein [Flavobacteriales bacterium]
MKQITVSIPDNQLQFFMEFLQNMKWKSGVEADVIEIPESVQNMMLDRVATAKEKDFEDWDDIKNSFDMK